MKANKTTDRAKARSNSLHTNLSRPQWGVCCPLGCFRICILADVPLPTGILSQSTSLYCSSLSVRVLAISTRNCRQVSASVPSNRHMQALTCRHARDDWLRTFHSCRYVVHTAHRKEKTAMPCASRGPPSSHSVCVDATEPPELEFRTLLTRADGKDGWSERAQGRWRP